MVAVVYRVLTLLLIVALSGCAWLSHEKTDPTANWSVSRLYSSAKQELNGGNYDKAITYLEKLEARYPFGRFAQQAQLDIAYAHYKAGETDQAVAAADSFIHTYPRNPFVDYAYYVKGLANYSNGSTILDRLFPSDPTRTDTTSAKQAFNDFAELVQKFPNSPYAKDARERMIFLRDNLAKHEIHVAKFYLARNAYVAAINRGKYVLQHYERTPSTEPALAIMAVGYWRLGMDKLSKDSFRVLKLNFPKSKYVAQLDAMFAGKSVPSFEKSKSLVAEVYDLL